MRPVNLIPAEERPGSSRPMRGGPIAYVIVGALATALIGVIVLVLTNNQISEREAEATTVRAETHAAEAKAQRLAAYTEFHTIHEQRVATVTSLADSRFDWERVMRELALVLPGNVWLTNLAGTVTPDVSINGAPSVALRQTVPGPALEIVGCARDQNAVAGFVQALKQIDGATRVGVQSSELGFASGASGGEGSGSATTSTCQTRRFIAQFQLVVAFDAAPVPEVASGEGGSTPPPAPTGSESGESTTTSSEGGEG
jgi:Tfp pilus assembly protein PilN